MRTIAAFVLVGSIALSARAQVDPGLWLPARTIFGPTTVEHLDPNGVHSVYPLGVMANSVARDGLGNVYVAETMGLGTAGKIHVFRAGLGEVGTLGPYGALMAVHVDATNHLWTVEAENFVLRKFRRLSPTGAILFTTAPDGYVIDALDAQGNAITHRQTGPSASTVRRVSTTGAIFDFTVPFLFERLFVSSKGDYVLAGGSTAVRVYSPAGAQLATFTLSGLPAQGFALDPCDVLTVLPLGFVFQIQRWRLDGVQLASIPLGGQDTVNQILPASDDTLWLLRVDSVTSKTIAQRVSHSGAVLQTFVPSTGDAGTSVFALGDMTGAKRVSAIAPAEDSDLDGIANAIEIEVGTDPLSNASVPPALSVGVVALLPTTLQIQLSDPARPSAPFAVIAGLSAGSGVLVHAPEPCPRIPISALDLATWAASGALAGPPFVGVLDAAGAASFQIAVPHLHPLGIHVRFTAITGVRNSLGIAPAVTTLIP